MVYLVAKDLTYEEYIKLAEETNEEWKRNFFLKMASKLEKQHADSRSD
jgi:hypothetical protein